MKKFEPTVKIIATIMAIVMVFVALPLQAIALDVGEISSAETVPETVTSENQPISQDVFIVEEDVSKRGQFEKHYLCSDGTYVSVTYPEAVHYRDDDNTWRDVDQSLSYDSTTGLYESNNSDFKVSFSESASSVNIASIEKNGYSLSWGIEVTKDPYRSNISLSQISENKSEIFTVSPSSAVKAQPVYTNVEQFSTPADRSVADEDSYILPDISSQINYVNAFSGEQNVSLKYTVYHNKIEEDIIIHNRGDMGSVSMNMDIGALVPVVNMDGSVDLVDNKGTMQFHIGIPYMMDANFDMCYDIDVTAKKNGSTCIITYTPDSEWFDSDERAFPIMLDPSITTSEYVSNIEDTYVEENSTSDHSTAQYLYISANGSVRRHAIVRVNQLPIIDESMPIISAQLFITLAHIPTSDLYLQADYTYPSVELYEYDYEFLTWLQTQASYSASSCLPANSTVVAFDFTPYINEMYSEEQTCLEVENDYNADFFVGFSSSHSSSAIARIHSSECTTPANRPTFKVTYGYSLPAGMLDGEVYSFKNVGSQLYMTVNGSEPANNSNVYQVVNDSGVATTPQKFKLEYVPSTGAYMFRSMSSSSGNGKVLDIRRAGGAIYSGRNVQVYSATDPISEEWFIVPVGTYTFRIIPRANMSLSLAAYGDNEGSNTGNTATSAGNIFVQTTDASNNNQKWYIYDNNDNDVEVESSSSVQTDTYYISNSYTGKYLHWSGSYANCQSGWLSDIGSDTVTWKITNLGDGYCTIQRADIPGYYLSASTGSSDAVRVYYDASGDILDTYKWAIITVTDELLIRNKSNGQYLYSISSSSNPSYLFTRPLYSVDSDSYKKQCWRIISDDAFVEPKVFRFDDLAIDIGETKTASVAENNGWFWDSYSDFDYTITSGSQYVSYNSSTHEFTGVAPGVATVLATNKTNGAERTFVISVCTSVVIPCTFAKTTSYSEIRSFSISITPYISDYSSYLSDATWHAYGNGVANFDLQNMTVQGNATGFAWLEARKNDKTILICYVYVEDILKDFSTEVQDFLYIDGSLLGTISCLEHDSNPGLDPYILRTEWYLYAIKMYNQGKSDEEIRVGLNEKFGLNISAGYTFQVFISEVILGSQGGYSRENLRLSFDGLRCLFDFYWFQYAAYTIATLDTVNVYTPATAQDVAMEKAYAQSLGNQDRTIVQNARQAQTSINYNPDNFQPFRLKKGTIVCGMLDGQTAWYTTPECAAQSNYNVKTLYNHLQVKVNEIYGYRTSIGYYEVTQDIYVACGQALNNSAYGDGGYTQYYIPDYQDVLTLLRKVDLVQ